MKIRVIVSDGEPGSIGALALLRRVRSGDVLLRTNERRQLNRIARNPSKKPQGFTVHCVGGFDLPVVLHRVFDASCLSLGEMPDPD